MREHHVDKWSVTELTMGDRLIFKHGSHAKIYTVGVYEHLFILGKVKKERRGASYDIIFSDPLMDSQFDEMGIMADLNVVINTNIINGLLVFSSLENAEDFLKGKRKEELVRETISIQTKISGVPIVSVDEAV